MRELTDAEIPTVVALGRQIAATPDPQAEATARIWSQTAAVPLEDPLKAKAAAKRSARKYSYNPVMAGIGYTPAALSRGPGWPGHDEVGGAGANDLIRGTRTL